ncbi:MAG TPA: ABC transporter substrate-binding protein [Candidatus Dormibacteraeota bacterium]|jgi:ABC-type transport system substrate-binding protein|nr:ABC transporter substrate-binding protein [Candidatus Dormibacteraeota bacterium]
MDTDVPRDLVFRELRGRMDRRRFLGVAGATSLSAVLAACGASAGPASGKKNGKAWAKAPVTFVFLDTQDPSHLDPALEDEFDSFNMIRNVYDPLVWTDEARSKLVPWLATSWESSSDGLTHTFHLRSGVTFHDGSSLDASAVKLSLDRYKAIGAPGEGYLLADMASVTVVDPTTVQVRMSTPDTWFPAHVTKFPIMSGQAITQNRTASDPWAQTYFASHAVGCGAYKFVSWQKGVAITLEKNASWWRGWQPGSIDKVIIKPTPESSTRVELIESGQADFCTEWAVGDAVTVGGKSGFTLRKYKTYDTDPIVYYNQKKPPFDNVKVRQALQYAFDYEAMGRYFQGYSSGMAGPFPPFYPNADRSLTLFKQDVSKAKSMLHAAGVSPSSLDITYMAASGYDDLVTAGTIVQSSLKEVGVKVSVQQLPFPQIEAAYSNASTAAMMTAIYNSPFTLDPTQFLSSFLPTNSTSIFSNYNNPAVANLINKIEATADKSEQQTLLNQVQKQIRDDAPCIFGATPETLIPVPDFVHGYVMQTTDYRFPCLFYLLRVIEH